jgi:hypothetical protein
MAADHCPNCGQENQIEDQFCIKCGTPLHKEVKTSLPTENTNNLVIPAGCAWCAERPGTQVIETIVQVQEANVKRTVHMHLERCDECERFSKKIRPIEMIVGWLVFFAFFAAFYGMVYAMQHKSWVIGIFSFLYVLYTAAEAMLWKRNYLRQLIVNVILALGLGKDRPSGYRFNQTQSFMLDVYGFIEFHNPAFQTKFASLNPKAVNPRTNKKVPIR